MRTQDSSKRPEDGTDFTLTRRGTMRAWAAAALGVAALTVPGRAAADYTDGVSVEDVWTEVLSHLPDNWGRWEPADEVGTLNYLDGGQAFRGMQAALRGPRDDIQVFALQPPYSGDVIPTPDSGDASKPGDPVFPTRQPARRDNVLDDRHYELGIVSPLTGGAKFADDAFITRAFLQGSSQMDALAESCDEDGVYEMLYVGTPLNVPGGLGAPLNLTVVKASRGRGGRPDQ